MLSFKENRIIVGISLFVVSLGLLSIAGFWAYASIKFNEIVWNDSEPLRIAMRVGVWLLFAASIGIISAFINGGVRLLLSKSLVRGICTLMMVLGEILISIGLVKAALNSSSNWAGSVAGYETMHGPLVMSGLIVCSMTLLVQVVLVRVVASPLDAREPNLASGILALISLTSMSVAAGFGLSGGDTSLIVMSSFLTVGWISCVVSYVFFNGRMALGIVGLGALPIVGLSHLFIVVAQKISSSSGGWWPSPYSIFWMTMASDIVMCLAAVAVGVSVIRMKKEPSPSITSPFSVAPAESISGLGFKSTFQ